MLSIAILDDNLKLLEEYERLIPAWFRKYNIKGNIVIATADYKEFLKAVHEQHVNVCIIDINLRSEVNGMYIAKCLRRDNINAEIIFCTGLLEYIHDAFDVNAYHFIPKPIGKNLEKCLVKLSKEIAARQKRKDIVEIKSGQRIYYVPMDFITHICRVGSKTIIHATNRILEVYDSLDTLLSRLNDPRFIKCHRATIINKNFIDYIDKKKKSVVLTNGFKCKLGPKLSMLLLNNEGGENLHVS